MGDVSGGDPSNVTALPGSRVLHAPFGARVMYARAFYCLRCFCSFYSMGFGAQRIPLPHWPKRGRLAFVQSGALEVICIFLGDFLWRIEILTIILYRDTNVSIFCYGRSCRFYPKCVGSMVGVMLVLWM